MLIDVCSGLNWVSVFCLFILCSFVLLLRDLYFVWSFCLFIDWESFRDVILFSFVKDVRSFFFCLVSESWVEKFLRLVDRFLWSLVRSLVFFGLLLIGIVLLFKDFRRRAGMSVIWFCWGGEEFEDVVVDIEVGEIEDDAGW